MKTRVISTEIWDSDSVYVLNIDTKLLYLILLTNPYIGQNRFYKISDRQLSTFSGLNIEQVQKCKKDLELANMVFFKDSYVCVTGAGFIECFYKGSKNEIAKNKELSTIPSDVLDYFSTKLDTLSIPYQYPSDRTINTKSGIINLKSEIINTKKVDFEEFWNLYPNKTEKKKTKEKWDKLSEEIQFFILEDLPKRKLGEKWIKDNGRFIEMPTTYLNGERWNDEIKIITSNTIKLS